MRKVFLTGWLAVLLVSPLAHAGVWGERGISKSFTIDGPYLYSADGRGVTVYDISNPASMHAVDVESGDHESFDVSLMGSNALLLATKGGVDRFDVASDGTLSRLGTWPKEGGVTRVASNERWAAAAQETRVFILERQGDALAMTRSLTFGHAVLDMVATSTHVFIAVESEAIYVIDPESGTEAGVVAIGSEALALSGSTLWSASGSGGLVAIDVSNPLSLEVFSTTGAGTIRIEGVAAAGNRVYGFARPNTIYFFDSSDPASPRLVATRKEWIDVAAAGGEHLFFSGPRLDRDGFPYETGTPVRAFDAANPASPQVAGEVRALAGPVSGVWTDGSIAYVVDPPFFRVLDVSKTDAPRELSAIQLPGDAQLRVRVKNGIAIVYGRDYVHLIDVSDPVRPRFKASWNPQGHSPDDAALMAEGLFVEVNEHSGIHVVNYDQYDPPAQVGGRIMHWHSVAAGDDAIYVLSGVLLTMSLSEGKQAQDVGVIAENALGIDTVPPNADRPSFVVLRQSTGIRLFSLHDDRFRPREIAFVPLPGTGAMATGENSLVVELGGILRRLDLSNPTVLIPTEMRVTSPMQISMAGEKIVVADRYRVRVYGPDTLPPPEPVTSKHRSVRR